MGIALYLAMTAAEFSSCVQLPAHMGWLACHFSPSGPGLSNIPRQLPPDSLLILDDSTPFAAHRPEVILTQLQNAVQSLSVTALILDFQRPAVKELAELAVYLGRNLPCSVVVPPRYAGRDLPVFLSPIPLHIPLAKVLAPWQGREIWLDVPCLPGQVTVTGKEAQYQWHCGNLLRSLPHYSQELCCHYGIEQKETGIQFLFHRTEEDLILFLESAQRLGVAGTVGLYQEWQMQKPPC